MEKVVVLNTITVGKLLLGTFLLVVSRLLDLETSHIHTHTHTHTVTSMHK